MTQPFALPAAGSRRWIDDPDGPQPTPARKPPRRRIALVPRSEERAGPSACPPAAGDRRAPRGAVPTSSQADSGDEANGTWKAPVVELDKGEPGADPGARAAEPTAAAPRARRKPRASAAPAGVTSKTKRAAVPATKRTRRAS